MYTVARSLRSPSNTRIVDIPKAYGQRSLLIGHQEAVSGSQDAGFRVEISTASFVLLCFYVYICKFALFVFLYVKYSYLFHVATLLVDSFWFFVK